MQREKAALLSSGFWPVGGNIGIFVSVLAIFFIFPVFATSFYVQVTLQSCFALLMLTMIYSVSKERYVLILCGSFIVPFLVFDSLSVINQSQYYLTIANGFYSIFLLTAILILAYHVLSSDLINTNVIFGAITIYLLAGIFWSKLYFLIVALHPGSFHGLEMVEAGTGDLNNSYDVQFNLMYYSFTTLATLGVGDITPVYHLAKSLTILEAVFGQLYIATVIAKIVSVWHPKQK